MYDTPYVKFCVRCGKKLILVGTGVTQGYIPPPSNGCECMKGYNSGQGGGTSGDAKENDREVTCESHSYTGGG